MNAVDHLLETDDRDAGCDGALEVIDAYCEAVLRGDDAAQRFPAYAVHMRYCTACREDTDGLLAAITAMDREA